MPRADRVARRSSRALIGIAGAIGAIGGVLVNLAFRQSFLSNGTGDAAYVIFFGFYVVCFARRPGRSTCARHGQATGGV